jgi:hypothetical protein
MTMTIATFDINVTFDIPATFGMIPCSVMSEHWTCRVPLAERHGVSQLPLLPVLLQIFENRVLRKIFGPKRDEVTGSREKYIMRSLMICNPHPLLCG